ncbi:MAG: hypothetical protein AAF690_02030 [Acidobacteriota bacterium]
MKTYGDRRWLYSALAVAALSTILHFGAELYLLEEPAFPLDDSWIHLQFARNLAAGEGMSFHPGRAVAGSTAPLWTGLLALGAWSPSLAIVWSKLLGIVFHLIATAALFSAARSWGLSALWSGLALLLFVLTDWVQWSALSGMEISLFLALSTVGLAVHLRWVGADPAERGTLPWATLWFALAALARPEGLLLLVLSWADAALRWETDQDDLRPRLQVGLPWALRQALCATIVLAPVGLYYLSISGSPLPTTFGIKSAGDGGVGLPNLRDLWLMVRVVFQPQPWMVLFLGAGLVASLRQARRGLLPVLWLFALPIAFSVLAGGARPNLGNFGRYLFPLFPVLLLVGCRGLDAATQRLPETLRFGAVRLRLRPLLALAVLAPTALGVLPGLQRYLTNVANVTDSDVAAGRWIAENLPPDARLAVQDIGAIAYFAPNPLVDMVGIVNPEILPYVRGDKMGDHPTRLGGWADFLRQSSVDYLVLFPRSYGGLAAIGEVMPGLVPVHSIRLERNITMAADELLVLAVSRSREAPGRE